MVETLFNRAPQRNPALRVRRFGAVHEPAVRYFLYADVLQELVKAARFRHEMATAILTGQFCIDDDGPFIEVVAFRRLDYLYGADPVESTRDKALKVYEKLEESGAADQRDVVGMFAAQPGGEAHLDEQTARVHLSLFNLPFQLAVVADGVNDLIGVYGRRPGMPFFDAGFHLVQRAEHTDDGVDSPEDSVDEPARRRPHTSGAPARLAASGPRADRTEPSRFAEHEPDMETYDDD